MFSAMNASYIVTDLFGFYFSTSIWWFIFHWQYKVIAKIMVHPLNALFTFIISFMDLVLSHQVWIIFSGQSAQC